MKIVQPEQEGVEAVGEAVFESAVVTTSAVHCNGGETPKTNANVTHLTYSSMKSSLKFLETPVSRSVVNADNVELTKTQKQLRMFKIGLQRSISKLYKNSTDTPDSC